MSFTTCFISFFINLENCGYMLHFYCDLINLLTVKG